MSDTSNTLRASNETYTKGKLAISENENLGDSTGMSF